MGYTRLSISILKGTQGWIIIEDILLQWAIVESIVYKFSTGFWNFFLLNYMNRYTIVDKVLYVDLLANMWGELTLFVVTILLLLYGFSYGDKSTRCQSILSERPIGRDDAFGKTFLGHIPANNSYGLAEMDVAIRVSHPRQGDLKENLQMQYKVCLFSWAVIGISLVVILHLICCICISQLKMFISIKGLL